MGFFEKLKNKKGFVRSAEHVVPKTPVTKIEDVFNTLYRDVFNDDNYVINREDPKYVWARKFLDNYSVVYGKGLECNVWEFIGMLKNYEPKSKILFRSPVEEIKDKKHGYLSLQIDFPDNDVRVITYDTYGNIADDAHYKKVMKQEKEQDLQ